MQIPKQNKTNQIRKNDNQEPNKYIKLNFHKNCY